MSVSIPFIFVLIMVFATLGVGALATRRAQTASDFFVAGRSVSVFWNASAISGEYLSAASFMGVAGLVMKNGYDALWYPVGYAAGYLFLLLFIAGPLRRFGAYTIPDFAEGRFDSPTFRKIAVIFVLLIGFFYTMPQMSAAGVTMKAILGWPYWAGILAVGTVITFNVVIGGMKGITVVQAFQYWAKVFAIAVPIFVLMAIKGPYFGHLADSLTEPGATPEMQKTRTVEIAGADKAPLNVLTGPPREVVSLIFPDGAEISKLSSSVKLPAGTAMPTFIRVEMGSGSKTTQPVLPPGMSWETTGVATGTHYSDGTLFVGKGGRITLVPKAFAGEDGKPLLASAKLEFSKKAKITIGEGTATPNAPSNAKWLNPFGPLTSKHGFPLLYTYSLIIALVCGTAGLPHILVRFYTNPDGRAAKKTTLWVMVMLGAFYVFTPMWGTLGRTFLPETYITGGFNTMVIKLPLILENETLGQVLSGVVAAGAFAAFMSTFSGLLVSMSGAFAHDIYGKIIRPSASSDERLKAFKIAAILIGAISMGLGLLVETFDIAMLVGWAFAIAAASYFPLLLLGAWWRGLTKQGAAAGMLLGGTLSLIAIVFFMLLDKKVVTADIPPLVKALIEQPAIWGVPLSIVTMVIVSKMTSTNIPTDVDLKMLRLHAPEELGHSKDYID